MATWFRSICFVDEAHSRFRYDPYSRPHFPFDIVAVDLNKQIFRCVSNGTSTDPQRESNRLITTAPCFASFPNEHDTALPPPVRSRKAKPRRTEPKADAPSEQQRTAWQDYIDNALAHHVSFTLWPASDKATEVERYNAQGVRRLKKANFRLGLIPVFAGQIEPRHVHIFPVCVRELLTQLEGKPFTGDVFVTMVGKKADPSKFGATVWTTAHAANLLMDERCRGAIRVTPKGYYLAKTAEEQAHVNALDVNPNRTACHRLPAHSVIFAESKLGKLNGN